MRYTSWNRTDRAKPVLMEEDGPDRLGEFGTDHAVVDGNTWSLHVDQSTGITAELANGRRLVVDGNLARASSLPVEVAGEKFQFHNESGKNWIIDDANGSKVGQFSGTNRGVRQAIVEFDGPAGDSLDRETIAALSYSARMVLESRLNSSSVALIITLVLCTIVAIVAFLF